MIINTIGIKLSKTIMKLIGIINIKYLKVLMKNGL